MPAPRIISDLAGTLVPFTAPELTGVEKVTVEGALYASTVITAGIVGGTTVNDWNPTGLQGCTELVVTSSGGSGPATIGGIMLVEHQIVVLRNDTGDLIYLSQLSAGSSAAYRFSFTSDSSNIVPPDGAVWLQRRASGGVRVIAERRGNDPVFSSVSTGYLYVRDGYMDLGNAGLDATGLTVPRAVQFPDKDGTVAYLDDVGSGGGGAVIFDAFETAHGFDLGASITKTSSGWALADRDADATAAAALVSTITDADEFVAVRVGPLTLTTGEWDAVTGDTGGLVEGEHYWLSSTPGFITKTAPTTGLLQYVGLALSDTQMLVDIGEVFDLDSGGGGGGGGGGSSTSGDADSTDPFASRVVCLLPLNGANGSRGNIVDLCCNAWMLPGGSDDHTAFSTAQSKFGGSSMLFDGNGDYIYTLPSSRFNFGTEDFTIEFWVRFNSIAGYNTLIDYGYTGGVLVYTDNNNGRLQFMVGGSVICGEASGMAIDTWYHVALTRTGLVHKIYRDGTETATGTTSSLGSYTSTANLMIGGHNVGSQSGDCYLQDVRITRALRYTGAFTPPATPFPDPWSHTHEVTGGGGGGGDGTSLSLAVAQTAHGLSVGMPIYMGASGWAQTDRDDATAFAAEAIVSAVADANNFTATKIGPVVLTTGEWDSRTGDSGGLVQGEFYYPSATAGGLTNGASQYTGYEQLVGKAHSTTSLFADVHTPRSRDFLASRVVCLLPLNGPNNGTANAVDHGDRRSWAFNGQAKFSTAQSKWGGSSLLTDNDGDFIAAAYGPAFNFGFDDFTIEQWVRLTSLSGYRTLFDYGLNASGAIYVRTGNGNGCLSIQVSNVEICTESTTLVVDTWYHIAITRSGTTFKIWRGGVETASGTGSASIQATETFKVGGTNYSGFAMNGYMQDFRITRALRYTGTFTPPTRAFPNP